MTVTINGTSGIAGTNGSAGTPAVQGEDTNTGIFFPAADTVAVATGGTERLRVSSAGFVGIGTSSPSEELHVYSADNAIVLVESVSATDSRLRLLTANDRIGYIEFGDTDDSDTGEIRYEHSTNAMIFATNGNVDRMRIDASGNMTVAKSTADIATVGHTLYAVGAAAHTASGVECLYINRLANDGTLVQFRQADTTEGTISVSGTTVSYNGGHLSRWAQFPDNSRPELLKGTVMSNLDQMSNWDGEENEQLNCVQVSTVEGDANVAGVFVAWDSTDDGYNDILLAMTGDMVIRIGAGVTVARGDLLMSAGDGTAKPQGDDIVRSKTIAKVTSTHVSHTYADGSYAVPCVLMAC